MRSASEIRLLDYLKTLNKNSIIKITTEGYVSDQPILDEDLEESIDLLPDTYTQKDGKYYFNSRWTDIHFIFEAYRPWMSVVQTEEYSNCLAQHTRESLSNKIEENYELKNYKEVKELTYRLENINKEIVEDDFRQITLKDADLITSKQCIIATKIWLNLYAPHLIDCPIEFVFSS